jgi:hypothetical protein
MSRKPTLENTQVGGNAQEAAINEDLKDEVLKAVVTVLWERVVCLEKRQVDMLHHRHDESGRPCLFTVLGTEQTSCDIESWLKECVTEKLQQPSQGETKHGNKKS